MEKLFNRWKNELICSMNKTISLLALNITALCLIASCGNNANTGSDALSEAKKLYEQSVRFKDGSTAIVALNQILLHDSNNMQYVDSLAGLYIKTGNYGGGLELANKVYAKDPKNYRILELIGLAHQQSGDYEASIKDFQTLFEGTKDYKYLYQTATIYLENEQLNTADSIADIILAQAGETDTRIEMSPAGVVESVPLKAACYNLKAMIQAEGKNNISGAVNYLRKALEIFPEFQFPQMYMQRIQQYQQMMRQGGQ